MPYSHHLISRLPLRQAIPVELLVKFKSFVEEPDTGKFYFICSLIQRRFHPKDLKVIAAFPWFMRGSD